MNFLRNIFRPFRKLSKEEWAALDAEMLAMEHRLDGLREDIEAVKREEAERRAARARLTPADLAVVLGAFSVSLVSVLKSTEANEVLDLLSRDLKDTASRSATGPSAVALKLTAAFLEASSPDD